MARVTRSAALQSGLASAWGVALIACGGDAPAPAATPPASPATVAPAPTVQAAPAPTAVPLPCGPFPYKGRRGNSFATGERIEWTNKTAEEFNRINGGRVTIENQLLGGNYTETLIASVAAGTSPDVARTSGAWFSDFIDKGNFVELGPYVKSDKLDPAQRYQLDEMLFRKGKQYAMPFW